MSVHRYIGVCLPFKTSTLLKTARVRTFILSILGFSLLFNITRFFEVNPVFFYMLCITFVKDKLIKAIALLMFVTEFDFA